MARNIGANTGMTVKQRQQSAGFVLPDQSVGANQLALSAINPTHLGSAVTQSLVEVGDIKPHGGGTIATGYLACDGSAVSRTTFAALFAKVSTTFGVGDGSTTFNVPDIRGRALINEGTGSGLTARTRGAQVGAETATLAIGDLPSHNHGGGVHNHTTVGNYITGVALSGGSAGGGGGPGWSTDGGTGAQNGVNNSGTVITSQGSGTGHANIQPSLVVKFVIKY